MFETYDFQPLLLLQLRRISHHLARSCRKSGWPVLQNKWGTVLCNLRERDSVWNELHLKGGAVSSVCQAKRTYPCNLQIHARFTITLKHKTTYLKRLLFCLKLLIKNHLKTVGHFWYCKINAPMPPNFELGHIIIYVYVCVCLHHNFFQLIPLNCKKSMVDSSLIATV